MFSTQSEVHLILICSPLVLRHLSASSLDCLNGPLFAIQSSGYPIFSWLVRPLLRGYGMPLPSLRMAQGRDLLPYVNVVSIFLKWSLLPLRLPPSKRTI